MRVLKSILSSSSRPKVEILTYSGSLVPEELIDWIIALDKYFDYEEVNEDKQVKFFVTRLRGHATLWWDGVQEERNTRTKPILRAGVEWWPS
jgi:hypothetical protein